MKLIAAVAVAAAITMFLLLNMGNQVRLRLFRDFQVNVLILVGLSFFAGAISVILFGLWRRWRTDTGGAAGKRAREAASDEGL